VRFTGCNLRCTWCDTAYAFYGGRQMSLDEVLACVRKFSHSTTTPDADPVKLVELTGGEPLLQAEATQLAERLLAEGYTVLVETSGERYVGRLPRAVIKIMDVKCPDSGEGGTFDIANLEALGAQDEVKFVITSRRDYDFARQFVQQHKLAARVRQILFSAVHPDPEEKWPGLDARQLAEWILVDNLPVRLGLQLHKIIWDPATKGV
jgi:7-carboxy-7-deazaguanine synthase